MKKYFSQFYVTMRCFLRLIVKRQIPKIFVMQRPIIFISIFCFLCLPVYAQQNLGINYQASIVDAGGNVLRNQQISVRVSITQSSATGIEVYRELHNNIVTSNEGFFSLPIGNGNAERGDFNDIPWNQAIHFLNVEVNGRQISSNRFETVPYAKVATNMQMKDLQNVSQEDPSNGQVLKWNGSQWAPAADNGGGGGTNLTPGLGIDINGSNVISNTGDTDATDDITTNTTAGGDLNGAFPNPTVNAIQNRPIANTAPNNGQVLKWNGSQWAPAADNGGGGGTNLTPGLGIDINGSNVISNTGDTDATDDITTNTTAGGDLNGAFPNPTVNAIQNRPIANTAPNNGQVLKWNGSQWAPAADDGGAGSSVWEQNGEDISYTGGNVSNINPNGQIRWIAGDIGNEGAGEIYTYGPSGSWNTEVGFIFGFPEYGGFAARGPQGEEKAVLAANPNNTGILVTNGANGSINTLISFITGSDNHGSLAVYDEDGLQKCGIYADPFTNSGVFYTNGANGNENIGITYLQDYPNNGFIIVRDANATPKVRIYVDEFGDGVLAVDGVKPFFMPHPNDKEKEIWYCALEGPEAATYLRGTANLVDGKAQISFPEHFQLVMNPETMTILTSPLSAQSEGLAIVRRNIEGFQVQELRNGKGNYEFDWEVKAIRKGYEDFQVIRDAARARPVKSKLSGRVTKGGARP